MKKSILFVLFAISFNSFAVLAPYWQSKREIDAVSALLAREDIQAKFKMHAITGITRRGDSWLIQDRNCFLEVKVIYIATPDRRAGPQEFELEPVDSIVCYEG